MSFAIWVCVKVASINMKHQSMPDSQKYRWGQYAPRRQHETGYEQEFGSGKTNIVICPECQSVYYGKSWHHSLKDYEQLSEDKNIDFELCPACEMEKNKQFEGFVEFKNVPPAVKEDLLRTIHNIEGRAFSRDPMDRVLKIEETRTDAEAGRTDADQGTTIEVYTSENQLAISIAKEVVSAFKGVFKDQDIKFSHTEDTVRISSSS